MLKKAKVVNIGFQHAFKNTLQTRSSEFSEAPNLQPDLNLQTFIRSSAGTTETYELLGIIRSPPVNLTQVLNQKQQNVACIDRKQGMGYEIYEMQQILPKQEISNQEKVSNKSIDIQISRTNSMFPNEQSFPDQINEQGSYFVQKVNQNTDFNNPLQNKSPLQNQQSETDQYFYLIPEKYQSSLYLILTHFLNYKMSCGQGKQNLSKTPSIKKRPKTSNNTQNFKIKPAYQMSDTKPFTAISQNRKQSQAKTMYLQENLTEDFNGHLQKIMQIEKQTQKKSKKIIFLENELTTCSRVIKQKNSEIRQMQHKQNLMKKKFKYEIQRLMKGKVMSDINQIFLSNLNEQKSNGKNVFEINGKKYVQTEDSPNITSNAFMTAPKSFALSKSSQKENFFKLQSFDPKEQQLLKKSQTMSQFKNMKSKVPNKKLQMLKLNRMLESLRKEIQKIQAQKETMLDQLAQNNANIEKAIDKMQKIMFEKKSQIEKYAEELNQMKDCTI